MIKIKIRFKILATFSILTMLSHVIFAEKRWSISHSSDIKKGVGQNSETLANINFCTLNFRSQPLPYLLINLKAGISKTIENNDGIYFRLCGPVKLMLPGIEIGIKSYEDDYIFRKFFNYEGYNIRAKIYLKAKSIYESEVALHNTKYNKKEISKFGSSFSNIGQSQLKVQILRCVKKFEYTNDKSEHKAVVSWSIDSIFHTKEKITIHEFANEMMGAFKSEMWNDDTEVEGKNFKLDNQIELKGSHAFYVTEYLKMGFRESVNYGKLTGEPIAGFRCSGGFFLNLNKKIREKINIKLAVNLNFITSLRL